MGIAQEPQFAALWTCISAIVRHVFFAFPPSNAAAGGGSDIMVGVTNDLKWVLYDILVLPYTILLMQILLIKFCFLLRKQLTKVSTEVAASFVKTSFVSRKEGFQQKFPQKAATSFVGASFVSRKGRS